MKKAVSVVLVLCVLLVICVGCASNFSIKGSWQQVGEKTFGQAQKGRTISFDGTHCNWYSPFDTYAFYKDGNDYRLDTTSGGWGDTPSFRVVIIDNNNIEIGGVSLTRVK